MKKNLSGAAVVPSIPKLVEEAYRENRLALFVGSGLSLGNDVKGGFPKWGEVGLRLLDYVQAKGLLTEKKMVLRRGCIEEADSLDELLNALESIKDDLGNHYRGALMAIFNPPDATPGAAHKAVHDLDVLAVLTTNYDRLLEQNQADDRLTHLSGGPQVSIDRPYLSVRGIRHERSIRPRQGARGQSEDVPAGQPGSLCASLERRSPKG
jgi:hypothetical protein